MPFENSTSWLGSFNNYVFKITLHLAYDRIDDSFTVVFGAAGLGSACKPRKASLMEFFVRHALKLRYKGRHLLDNLLDARLSEGATGGGVRQNEVERGGWGGGGGIE